MTLLSYWRAFGRSSVEQTRQYQPATKTTELQTTTRVVGIHNGEIEFVRAITISDIQPAASSTPTSVNTTHEWIWRAAGPQRNRSWDKRWFLTSWNDWRAGNSGAYTSTGGGSTSHIFSVSLWAILILACIPYVMRWGRAILLRYRARQGLCPACEYDRRGLPRTTPCPECGFELSDDVLEKQ